MKTPAALLAALLLGGCATAANDWSPVFDPRGVDIQQLDADLAECRSYAKQTMDAAQGAMAGAVAGALLGALLAPRGYRNDVAGRAAVIGGLGGAGQAEGGQRGIISRCMAGRGYKVLN